MPATGAQFLLLTQAAEAAATNAYAPYSNFYVGAAVLLKTGEIVAGCNVENASYRLTTCAEQAAIVAAVACFGPAIRIQAIVIVNRAQVPCAPCGACRQTIAEFASPDATIIYPGHAGAPQTASLADLLPASFAFEPAGHPA